MGAFPYTKTLPDLLQEVIPVVAPQEEDDEPFSSGSGNENSLFQLLLLLLLRLLLDGDILKRWLRVLKLTDLENDLSG